MAVKKEPTEGAGVEKMVKKQVEKAENKFTKEQLAASGRFRDRRDIVEALLKTGELYTVKAVEEKIEKFMKGQVE